MPGYSVLDAKAASAPTKAESKERIEDHGSKLTPYQKLARDLAELIAVEYSKTVTPNKHDKRWATYEVIKQLIKPRKIFPHYQYGPRCGEVETLHLWQFDSFNSYYFQYNNLNNEVAKKMSSVQISRTIDTLFEIRALCKSILVRDVHKFQFDLNEYKEKLKHEFLSLHLYLSRYTQEAFDEIALNTQFEKVWEIFLENRKNLLPTYQALPEDQKTEFYPEEVIQEKLRPEDSGSDTGSENSSPFNSSDNYELDGVSIQALTAGARASFFHKDGALSPHGEQQLQKVMEKYSSVIAIR